MMRVFYGTQSGHAHRYQCRGDDLHVGAGVCIGIGGVRVDRAVVERLLDVVAPHAINASIEAAMCVDRANRDVREALVKETEEAKYEASLASRRYEAVDPSKRLVARELEARWDEALKRVADLEERIAKHDASVSSQPAIDRPALLALARDLPAAWNAPGVDARTKQRLVRAVIREVIIDLDDAAGDVVVTVHWTGGRHTELRVARVRTGRYPDDRHPSAVDVVRTMGGKWPDRDLAVTMNRMRCKSSKGETWTTVRVRELRERLGIPAYEKSATHVEHITVDRAAQRLGICVGSVHRLIREKVLPATQIMPSAPWQIPVASLETEAVRIGAQSVIDRRPRNAAVLQDEKALRLPGV